MNTEVKKQWLDALRSGTYRQGYGTLRRNDQFCCLGVLCDLVDKTKWEPPTHDGFRLYNYSYNYPDRAVANKSGLTSAEFSYLATLNDNGTPFADIAQVIEEHY